MYDTLKGQVCDMMCASLAKTKNTSSTADKYFRYIELGLLLRPTLNALKLITHDRANTVCAYNHAGLELCKSCVNSHVTLALTLMCASAVCWLSNHGGADKLGCLLRALPIAARSGSFTASTVNVCVYLGAAAAAMGCCLQGEIHRIVFQLLMQCTSQCNHLHLLV